MKKIVSAALLAFVSAAFLSAGLAACSADGSSHEHTFSEDWSFDETSHWHAADCGDAEEVADMGEHVMQDGACTVCGCVTEGTAELTYELSGTGTYYSVTGLDGDSAAEIVIPSIYSGLPVKTIASDSFSGNTTLTGVTIGGGITEIDSSAFYGCTSLRYAALPDSLTSIGYEAFRGCGALESITLGTGLTSLGDNAFYGCSLLTEINFNAAACANLSSGNGVFCLAGRQAGGITVNVGAQVTYIPSYLFCSDTDSSLSPYITEVVFAEGGACGEVRDCAFAYADALKSIVLPEAITSVGEKCFYSCGALESVTIPATLTAIGRNAFSDCTALEGVYISDISAWCAVDFDGSKANPLYYAGNLYIDGSLATQLTIPEGVTDIADYAFCGGVCIVDISIADTVASVGNYAFSGCSSLKTFVAGAGLKEVGSYSFSGCSSLEGVCISDVAAWCAVDFDSLQSNPLYYAGNLYIDGSLATQLTIPEGVTAIADFAFAGCTSVLTITISDGVSAIGAASFRDCANLSEINVAESVISVGNNAFYGCDKLIQTENGISYAGSIAIDCDSSLTAAELRDGTLIVADYAFAYCTSLESVTMPKSVRAIGNNAFYGCSSLQTLTLGEGVTRIGNYAFYGCTSLKSVEIPAGLSYIGNAAFSGCSSLEGVFYYGTAIEWENGVTVGPGNTLLTEKLYCYSQTQPTAEGNYWHYNDNGGIEIWDTADE